MKAATTKNGADLRKKGPPTKKPTNPLEQLAWALTSVISNTELRLAKEIEDEGHRTRNSLIHWGEALQSYWVRSTQKADVQAAFKASDETICKSFAIVRNDIEQLGNVTLERVDAAHGAIEAIGKFKAVKDDQVPHVMREVACVRSDTLAIMRMIEGEMGRLSRVELLLQQLVNRPAEHDTPAEKAAQDEIIKQLVDFMMNSPTPMIDPEKLSAAVVDAHKVKKAKQPKKIRREEAAKAKQQAKINAYKTKLIARRNPPQAPKPT